MSLPFGFGLPDDGSGDSGVNPLAGFGEMLQSIGRAMSQAQGQTAVTGAGLIASADEASDAAPTSAQAEGSALEGLTAMCAGWVDSATALAPTQSRLQAWTPKRWVAATADDWARFAAPVADSLGDATTAMMQQADIPQEQLAQMAAMLAPMQQMMKSMTIALMQQQLGAAIGKLSNDVLYAGELPMVAPDSAAVMPGAIDSWVAGLEIPAEQVYAWVVTREIAAHRLAATATWLPGVLRNSVLAHSTGVTIDHAKIAEVMQGVDPSNPQELADLLNSGLLEPAQTPQQEQALSRLQTLVALVDGWVDVVCEKASPAWVPTARLDEAYRRRRATNSPAQQALGALAGLEINPKKVREAADLWRRITETHGVTVRDGLWAHPDLLPGADDLADPQSFLDALGAGDEAGPELGL